MAAYLLPLLGFIASSLIFRTIATLGIGFFTYGWITSFTDNVVNHVQTQFTGIPANLLQILQLSGFGTALSLILSAFTTIATIKAMKMVIAPLSIFTKG